MRRGAVLQMLGIGVVVAVCVTLVALLIPWLPAPAGKEAGRIDFVFWFTTAIAIAVFSLVATVVIYSVWKFGAAPDDDSDGPPTHGHTGLEIWWTAIPAVLVTAISIVSAIVLAQNSDAGSNPVRVKVTAQQFAWHFQYANGKESGVLRLPVGRHAELSITAKDVIHSFWVPQLSQKQDAVPGQTNKLVVTPTRIGTYPVVCTELCGLGHALMRSTLIVTSPADFARWLAAKGTATATSPGLAAFGQYGCGGCHTFKPAGSTGTIGPDLGKLQQYAKQAGKPLAAFIRTSIVDPSSYIQPGYPNDMPPTFKQQIPAKQLDQLVQYLAGGGK